MFTKYIRIVVLLVVLSLLMVWTVSAQETTEIPEVVVSIRDDGVTVAPSEISAGISALEFENVSDDTLFAAFILRLNEGVTTDDFRAAVEEANPIVILQMVSLYGGVDIEAGESSDPIIVDLKAGTHVLLPGLDAPPVFFEVYENDMPTAKPPEADVTLAMVDYAFGTPSTIEAGEKVWHLQNLGQELHQAIMIKVDEGTTLDEASDLLATTLLPSGQLNPDSPVEIVFLWSFISAGENVWVTLDLEPGTYALGCEMPDFANPTEPANHLDYNMVRIFTVE